MTANSSFPIKDQREKQKFLIEVGSKENQLWALIHSKGLLHSDVQDLYRKVRSSYENLILSDHEQLELQDIEYSLWKLHYKHIDEFRKRIKGSSVNAESKNLVVSRNDSHLDAFKVFLSEAIGFYQNLVAKIRKCNRFQEESMFDRKPGNLSFSEQKKTQKCQFLCHRFLVCLGDLARYKEQYEKPDVQNRNWSVAATNYLEATVIWPDSGNPHNQLAVLAIYIGDEFLALYHCIRSLAVKEPFPDAQGNLILLFERSRSSQLYPLSSEAHFNFLNPSEKYSLQSIAQSSDDTKLWSLIIGLLSFFHIKSSVNEFPCAFASAMRELDALMGLSDTKLKSTLESYQRMNSVKRGPFRALQVVSVLIFITQNPIETPEMKESRDKNGMHQKELTQLALTATFILMGRFVERCLKTGAVETCPLLPAVLVFLEWLVVMLDTAEIYGVDENSRSAMSYFFDVLVDLLQRMNLKEVLQFKFPEVTPLWEDYELRGFAPVACAHASLDFSSHSELIDNYDSGFEFRAQRIINAAMKIADRSTGSQKWILYDKSRSKFCKVAELGTEERDKQKIGEENPSSNGKSVDMEDEEVILFRPLTRHNSAPLKKDMEDRSVPSDECLRRASSLLIAENQSRTDPLSFHADITNFRRNMSLEPAVKEQPFLETPIAAGPPSLSAWVLDGGNSSKNKEESASGLRLSPIEELAAECLDGLSITENEESIVSHEAASTQSFPSTYTTPVPSAPFLPDDAVWFNGQVGSYSNWNATPVPPDYGLPTLPTPSFMEKYPPGHRMTSSEWLRQYRESLNLAPQALPSYPYPTGDLGNLYGYDTSRYHHINRWGNHAPYNPPMHMNNNPTLRPGNPDYGDADGQRREWLFPGYQRTTPYGCGAVRDLRNEPQPLVQYLKEKEMQVQGDPTVRGPSYMDN